MPDSAWVIGYRRDGRPIYAMAGAADNVAITAGSGTTVGTDEFTINSVAVHLQRVLVQGSSTVANGQVSPTGTAATLLAARDTRMAVTFLNYSDRTVYIGIATVTTANGFPLDPGAAVTMGTTALVQAITASGTAAYVAYFETYS